MVNQQEIAKELNLTVGQKITTKTGSTYTIVKLTEKSVIHTWDGATGEPCENRESYNTIKKYLTSGAYTSIK